MNIFNRDYSFKKNHKLSHLEFYPLLFYVHLIKNITWLKHHRINHQLSFFYIFLEMYLLNLLNTHTHTNDFNTIPISGYNSASNRLSPSALLSAHIAPVWCGELANLRGDKGQMDFSALDYSHNKREGQAEWCCRGKWPSIHSRHNTFKKYERKILPNTTTPDLKSKSFLFEVAATIADLNGMKSAPCKLYSWENLWLIKEKKSPKIKVSNVV